MRLNRQQLMPYVISIVFGSMVWVGVIACVVTASIPTATPSLPQPSSEG